MNLTRMAIYIQSPATITMKKSRVLLRLKKNGLDLFYFSFHFLFSFGFIFLFSIFRTTRVRVDRSRCHISHKCDGIVIRLVTRLGRT